MKLYRINSVEIPREPLKGYENTGAFKVYLSDTGLLSHICGMKYREKFKPPYAIRFSEKNFGFENGILSVPLYAAFCVYGH